MRRFEKAVLGWSARVLRARTRRAAGNPAGHACTEEARTAWFPGTCPAAAARLPLLELAEGRQCSIWKGGRIKNSNNGSLIDSVEPSSDVTPKITSDAFIEMAMARQIFCQVAPNSTPFGYW
jgi:hypothetical protein